MVRLLESSKCRKEHVEGQVLASRLPILDSLLIPLQASGKKKRAALGIQVDINNKRIWILNTDHEVEVFKLGFEDRKKQLASLLDFTARLHTPVVIMEDFNTTGDQRPTKYLSNSDEVQLTYQILKDHGFTWPHSIPENEFTYESLFINNFLDHIFLKDLKPYA
jgi:endonuclease/exonuclease/phosphatase family metal-dependent hydrolase